MGPVVQILRLVYLFYDIYGTYKVLKVPAPSARSSAQPTVRAMVQRKCDVKDVMTTWIVLVRSQILPPAVRCVSVGIF